MAVDLADIKVKQNRDFDIKPVNYEQVIQAGDDYYIIDAATSQIVKEINEVDSRLHVKYNTTHNFFVLFAKEEERGQLIEYLVKTFTELDPRIVHRVKEISDPSYDFIKEEEELEKQADKDKLHAVQEDIGERAERLAHALRKDLGIKNRAFMSSNGVNKKKLSDGKDFLGGIRTDAKKR